MPATNSCMTPPMHRIGGRFHPELALVGNRPREQWTHVVQLVHRCVVGTGTYAAIDNAQSLKLPHTHIVSHVHMYVLIYAGIFRHFNIDKPCTYFCRKTHDTMRKQTSARDTHAYTQITRIYTGLSTRVAHPIHQAPISCIAIDNMGEKVRSSLMWN